MLLNSEQNPGKLDACFKKLYICLLYFASTELNNQIARAVFINNESTKIE